MVIWGSQLLSVNNLRHEGLLSTQGQEILMVDVKI